MKLAFFVMLLTICYSFSLAVPASGRLHENSIDISTKKESAICNPSNMVRLAKCSCYIHFVSGSMDKVLTDRCKHAFGDNLGSLKGECYPFRVNGHFVRKRFHEAVYVAKLYCIQDYIQTKKDFSGRQLKWPHDHHNQLLPTNRIGDIDVVTKDVIIIIIIVPE